jgi:hypothetical protein
MRELEARGLPYLFKLRLTANVKRTIERLSKQRAWTHAGHGFKAKESVVRQEGWSQQRREICVTAALEGNLAAAKDSSRVSRCSALSRSARTPKSTNIVFWPYLWTKNRGQGGPNRPFLWGAQLSVRAANTGRTFRADRFLPLAFSSKSLAGTGRGRYAAREFRGSTAIDIAITHQAHSHGGRFRGFAAQSCTHVPCNDVLSVLSSSCARACGR